MIAKLITLCCACAAALAAPGIYGSVPALAPAYAGHGLTGIAAPAYASYSAPVFAKQVLPAAIAAPVIHAEPIDPNPAYQFSYGVSDPSTGDQKDASESLQNGVVHGSYSLVEPDGHLRRVTYTADKINGFNAVVERTGGAHAAPLAVAPVAKVLAPAPVAVAAPISRLTLPAIGHPWG